MKTVIALALVTLVSSQNAFACRITPKGMSSIQVTTLHKTLGDSEMMTSFSILENGNFEIKVNVPGSDSVEIREYRLENTSRMCPVLNAIRVK
jgi:hypothetical protein